MTTVFRYRLLSVTMLVITALLSYCPQAIGQVSGGGAASAGPSLPSTTVSPGVAATGMIAGAPPARSVDWQHGPRKLALLDQAHIALPADYAYLDRAAAQQFLRGLGNPNVDDVIGLISGADGDWLIVVRFEKSGFIRETDTRNWDVDALLEKIRAGAEHSNLQRRGQGASELEILGWLEQPAYDAQLHRLRWGIAVRNLGEVGTDTAAINYNTYALGREGYFTLNLITNLQQIDKNRPHASKLIAAFEFEEGKRYTDYAGKEEPMASFGLSALVSNGIGGKNPAQALPERGFFSTNATALLLTLGGVILLAAGVAAGWYWLRKRKTTAPPALLPASEPETSEPQ